MNVVVLQRLMQAMVAELNDPTPDVVGGGRAQCEVSDYAEMWFDPQSDAPQAYCRDHAGRDLPICDIQKKGSRFLLVLDDPTHRVKSMQVPGTWTIWVEDALIPNDEVLRAE